MKGLINIERISGIYQIKNIKNNFIYIGKSNNIYRRWNDHKRNLKLNKHKCILLQNDYVTYEIDSFEFSILEVTDNIHERELDYIYSISKDAKLYNNYNKREIIKYRIITKLRKRETDYLLDYSLENVNNIKPLIFDIALLNKNKNIYKLISIYSNNENLNIEAKEKILLSIQIKDDYCKNNNITHKIITYN